MNTELSGCLITYFPLRVNMLVFSWLRVLWRYRWFVLQSALHDLRNQSTNTVLGWLWPMINPLAQVLLYMTVFVDIMRVKMPGSVEDSATYAVYLCVGIFSWSYFSLTISRCTGVFVDMSTFIKKIYFPRFIIPCIPILSTTIQFMITVGVFLVVVIFFGKSFGSNLLWLAVVLIVQQMIAIGLGLVSGVLNVFFRDVGHVISILLGFWFWLTPIVYPMAALPPGLRWIIEGFNPMTAILASYQNAFLTGQAPDLISLWPHALLGIGLLVLAAWLFRRLSPVMANRL